METTRRRCFVTLTALAVASWASLAAAAGAAPPAGVPPCPSGEDKPDVAQLVRRTEQLLQGRTSVGVMAMTIKTPSWTRKLKMKVWTRDRDFALVRVIEGGPRETGMMTLKREKQLWNYLPQAGRVMKLPSGMLGDSWMGSDFTNDDLVKGSSLVEDFDARVEGVVQHEGKEAWKAVLVPKPSAVVVWGRVELLIDRATCLPLAEHFFDEDGKPARHLLFGDFREVGWRKFPARTTIIPAEEGRETTVLHEQIEFDVDIPEETFSLHRLQKGR